MTHRIHRSGHFTHIPNELLRDKRLSFKARGIMAFILSNVDEWTSSQGSVGAMGTEGREAVRSAYQELERLGYARFETIAAGTKKSGSIWHYHDFPVPESERTNITRWRDDPKPVETPTLREAVVPEHRDYGNPTPREPDTSGTRTTSEDQGKEDQETEDLASPAKPTDPTPAKVFIHLWMKAFEEEYGDPYIFAGGKDGAAVKALVKMPDTTPEQLIDIAVKAWKARGNRKFFSCGQSITIAGFRGAFVRIRVELKDAGRISSVESVKESERKGDISYAID